MPQVGVEAAKACLVRVKVSSVKAAKVRTNIKIVYIIFVFSRHGLFIIPYSTNLFICFFNIIVIFIYIRTIVNVSIDKGGCQVGVVRSLDCRWNRLLPSR